VLIVLVCDPRREANGLPKCHSDLGLMECTWRSYPPTPVGQVGGHEGVGVVVKLGPNCEGSKIALGQRVGIKYVSGVCMNCDHCLEGMEPLCEKATYSGFYTPGTFQQYVLSPANYVTPIPDGVDSAAVAPMLCAGLTVYTALRKAGAKSGQWVVVSGAGGGLGHIACQLGSRGMALRILGVDAGNKEKLVKESGAEAFIDVLKHDDKSIAEEVKRICGGRGANAVIMCTASDRAYGQAISMLRKGGTMVCVGMPEGDPVLIGGCYPAAIVSGQVNITSAAVGSRQDAKELLDFAARGVITSHYKLEKLENLTSVFKEMSEGKLIGRVVLDLT
jgi:propanol-preferring alcohol dehydrogenase